MAPPSGAGQIRVDIVEILAATSETFAGVTAVPASVTVRVAGGAGATLSLQFIDVAANSSNAATA
jgi:hypothetical protein